MSDFIEIQLKNYLDEGKTLIECRGLGVDLSNFPDKNYNFYSLPENEFPDDYFQIQNDGNFYFTQDKLDRYRRLPFMGIILKNGMIYKVGSVHSKTALWLKFNKTQPDDENYIDLTGSLRYVYFPGQDRLSIVQGYDYSKRFDQTNVYKLIYDWTMFYDNTKYNTNILLNEKQIVTLFKLCQRLGTGFEKMLDDNIGFCMDTDDPALRKNARDNNDLINKTLSALARAERQK